MQQIALLFLGIDITTIVNIHCHTVSKIVLEQSALAGSLGLSGIRQAAPRSVRQENQPAINSAMYL